MRSATERGYRFGQFTLNLDRASVEENGVRISLRPKSFDVLRYFLEHPARVASKDELVAAVWPNVVVSDDSLAQCIRDIRKALRDGDERFIRTVPRRGYIFTAEVEPLDGARDDGGASRRSIRNFLRGWRRQTAAAIALLLVLGVSAGGFALFQAEAPMRNQKLTLAILPFVNAADDQGEEWLGEGIAEDIMTAVSRFQDLSVIARNSSFRYRGEAVDPRQIGRELNADFLLQGSVRRAGDQLRITLQLVDARTGASRWTERFDRPLRDVFAIQDEIAQSVAGQLVAHAREATIARVKAHPPESLAAYELVLRGRKAYLTFSREGALEGRALLERAVAIDPDYAPAWELLSRLLMQSYLQPYDASHGAPEILQQARDAAERAVTLDPHLSTAHGSLGWALVHLREYDVGLEAFRTALQLNPNDADSLRNYASVLGHVARYRDSLRAWDESIRVDPFFPPIVLALKARAYVMLGEYEAGLPLARSCAERAPRLLACYYYLAIAANELGNTKEAAAASRQILEINPRFSIGQLLRVRPIQSEVEANRFAAYLRRAGLPE